MKRIFRTILFSILELLCCYYFIWQLDNYTAFDVVIAVPIAFIGFGLLVTIAWYDKNQYPEIRQQYKYLPTIILSIIILSLPPTIYFLRQRDNSPSQFYCVSKVSDFNGVSIDFRKDNTYKLSNWCMGESISRGKYIVKDSIITLSNTPIGRVIVSSKLVIRSDGPIEENGEPKKSIYQVNENGTIINSAIDFWILKR